MRLLLDTNVLLWLFVGGRRLPDELREALGDRENVVNASVASLWEIAIKQSIGKLRAPADTSAASEQLGLALLDVTASHALGVRDLPLHHRDPFDRLLVSQAIAEDATLVTADQQLDAYAAATWLV